MNMEILIISIAVLYAISLVLAIYEIVKAPLVNDEIKEWEDKL